MTERLACVDSTDHFRQRRFAGEVFDQAGTLATVDQRLRLVQPSATDVAVDEHSTEARFGHDHREVQRNERLAITRAWARDGERDGLVGGEGASHAEA